MQGSPQIPHQPAEATTTMSLTERLKKTKKKKTHWEQFGDQTSTKGHFHMELKTFNR